MSYGPYSVFTRNLASNTTLTSALDLGRAWKNVYLEIPTMTSGTDVYIQAAATLDGTMRRVYQRTNSATAQSNVWIVKSNITQVLVDLPAGLRYVAVEISTAMTQTSVNFNVHCSD
jgi:hypothetical protein